MKLTDERFFTQELRGDYPGLERIAEIYEKRGTAAAEEAFAAVVRRDFNVDALNKLSVSKVAAEAEHGEADNVLKGNVISVGFRYQFPNGRIMWKENPTYNQYKEWTWQLSRHSCWRELGRAYRETGDERYAEGFARQFLDWCDQAICPEPGVSGYATECWRTIEAGIRMIGFWPYAFGSFYRSPSVSDHVITTFMKSVVEHGYRLTDAFTTHNWIIMEMGGLARLGMFYPWLAKADEWRAFAIDRMIEEYDTQFYKDGFQYELSTGYQGIHITVYEDVMKAAEAFGFTLPDAFLAGYERVFGMYGKLCYPDGKTPALNDGHRSSAADAYRHAVKYFPGREDFLWFATERKEGKAPEYDSVALPYSGMVMFRTGWDNEKDVDVFFESAPFGFAHQHEDKLNVLMYAYGKEVLPDTGNYAYDTSDMRNFILSSRGHNTGMMDDRGQNRRADYRWKKENIQERSNLHFALSDGFDTAEGEYNEGYGAEKRAGAHKRKVIFFKKGLRGGAPFAVVIDRMTGMDGENHRFAIHYQMDNLPFTVFDRAFTQSFGDGVELHLITSEKPEVVLGQTDPYLFGWKPNHEVTGREPRHFAAPAVRMKASGVPSYRFGSVLFPTKNAQANVTGISLSQNVDDTAFTLTFSDGACETYREEDFPCDDVEK